MSDKINRLIQQASIDKERAERLLEEIQVMDKQIADLTAELAEANSQLERYRLTNTEENNLNILAHEIDAASRALKEKP